MSLNDESSDVTTSLRPGALLMSLSGLKVLMILKIFSRLSILTWFLATMLMTMSTSDTKTRLKSMMFQMLLR